MMLIIGEIGWWSIWELYTILAAFWEIQKLFSNRNVSLKKKKKEDTMHGRIEPHSLLWTWPKQGFPAMKGGWKKLWYCPPQVVAHSKLQRPEEKERGLPPGPRRSHPFIPYFDLFSPHRQHRLWATNRFFFWNGSLRGQVEINTK